MKIKVKGIGQNIDKRTIKKILKDENTLVICKDFLTAVAIMFWAIKT